MRPRPTQRRRRKRTLSPAPFWPRRISCYVTTMVGKRVQLGEETWGHCRPQSGVEHLLLLIACLAMVSVTPARAAPPEIEDFCFAQLEKVRPPLSSSRGDREAFMANCIADLTPPRPSTGYRYKKPRN